MKIVLEFQTLEELQDFVRAEYAKLPMAVAAHPLATAFQKAFPRDRQLDVTQCERILSYKDLESRVKSLRLFTGIGLKDCKKLLQEYATAVHVAQLCDTEDGRPKAH